MPVRSLSSPVLRWPEASRVEQALREWAGEIVRQRGDVVRIGYFGSYARGGFGETVSREAVWVYERNEPRGDNHGR